jgi:hypothetical protein
MSDQPGGRAAYLIELEIETLHDEKSQITSTKLQTNFKPQILMIETHVYHSGCRRQF